MAFVEFKPARFEQSLHAGDHVGVAAEVDVRRLWADLTLCHRLDRAALEEALDAARLSAPRGLRARHCR